MKKTILRARQLRREMTRSEAFLWSALRGRQLCGVRFRRQHPMGRYILDFYACALRLAVEVDGQAHEGRARADEVRTCWLERQGVRVLRVTVDDVEVSPTRVIERLRGVIEGMRGGERLDDEGCSNEDDGDGRGHRGVDPWLW